MDDGPAVAAAGDRPGLRARLWQHIAGRRGRRPYAWIAAASGAYLQAYRNTGNYRLELDGEERVLGAFATDEPATVLDVGANIGEWSTAAAATMPGATIHAFEPVVSTCGRLRANLAHLGPRVVVNGFGLSDRDEHREITVPSDGSALSSLVTADGDAEKIELRRGDGYCDEAGIERVRLLKIDTEGWDHLVLQGFTGMLAAGRIDAIQFEYGPWALETRFLLKDFFDLLQGAGMVVGKVYPHRVEFGPYRAELEDFRGLNFLAVDRSATTLVDRLRGGR